MLNLMVSYSHAATFKPYWSVSAEYSLTRLKNQLYNEQYIFGKGNNSGYGIGIGTGLRIDIDKIYIGTEIFITANELLDEKSTQTNGTEIEREELKVYSLFNTRLNFGYNFNKKLTLFGLIGFRNIEYESTHKYEDTLGLNQSGFRKFNVSKIAPIFGFGLNYSISKRFETRFSYEYSYFKIHDGIFSSPSTEGRVELRVNTFKLGLNYMF